MRGGGGGAGQEEGQRSLLIGPQAATVTTEPWDSPLRDVRHNQYEASVYCCPGNHSQHFPCSWLKQDDACCRIVRH